MMDLINFNLMWIIDLNCDGNSYCGVATVGQVPSVVHFRQALNIMTPLNGK